jgi:hypothetical protein
MTGAHTGGVFLVSEKKGRNRAVFLFLFSFTQRRKGAKTSKEIS